MFCMTILTPCRHVRSTNALRLHCRHGHISHDAHLQLVRIRLTLFPSRPRHRIVLLPLCMCPVAPSSRTVFQTWYLVLRM